ncbi:hypothetical protein FOZ63_019032, partial [Perkinsus olseni]
EIVQHWRDIGVQYEVKLVPGKTNEVADRLSRLAQEHDLANTIYGNTLSDGWMDEKCFIPPNDSKSADVSDVASLLTIEEVSDKLTDGNDYLDLYNDLLIVRAFSAWKKHAGGGESVDEATLDEGIHRAKQWLKNLQRTSVSLRPIFTRLLGELKHQDRYVELHKNVGPFYRLSTDGLLEELRYPQGDILAVPVPVVVLPTDDMKFLESL